MPVVSKIFRDMEQFLFICGACCRLEEMEKHEIRGPPRGIRTAPLIQLTRALCRPLLPFCKMRRTRCGLNTFGGISGSEPRICVISAWRWTEETHLAVLRLQPGSLRFELRGQTRRHKKVVEEAWFSSDPLNNYTTE